MPLSGMISSATSMVWFGEMVQPRATRQLTGIRRNETGTAFLNTQGMGTVGTVPALHVRYSTCTYMYLYRRS